MTSRDSSEIHESDLTIPVVKLLNEAPGGFLATSELIDRLEQKLSPKGKDAEILEGRNDSHFSQKVRNIISHRNASTNPIARGLIVYKESKAGLEITDKGRAYIASLND